MSGKCTPFLSAIVLALAAAVLPATASVTYSFTGGVSAGTNSAIFAFVVTTPQFITPSGVVTPSSTSCLVAGPNFESCDISGDIFFIPRIFGNPPSVSFSALLDPVNDAAYSQSFGAGFAFPPGADVFATPGVYQATSFTNLLVARLEVSGFNDPISSPIPEPSTWLLLMGGFSLMIGAAVGRRGRSSKTVAKPVRQSSVGLLNTNCL